MKIKQKQRAKPMRNFALSMVSPLTLSLSPWGEGKAENYILI